MDRIYGSVFPNSIAIIETSLISIFPSATPGVGPVMSQFGYTSCEYDG